MSRQTIIYLEIRMTYKVTHVPINQTICFAIDRVQGVAQVCLPRCSAVQETNENRRTCHVGCPK